MTLKAILMAAVLALTPALVMANADNGKAKGAGKAAAKKADSFHVWNEAKGSSPAATAKGSQAAAKGGKPATKLSGGDDPIGTKGAAPK